MNPILMEGPDGGGKTYTAKTAFADYAYQHNGPPPKDAASVFWWQLEGLLPRQTRTYDTYRGWVVDRSWPSEQIYHRFAGRPHAFHPFAHRMFERVMLSYGGVVVMCLPPYDVAYREWARRVDEGKELLTDPEQFATMYEFYKSWRLTTCLPVLEYDFTRTGVRILQEGVYDRQHAMVANPAPGVIAGNAGASILMVGEQYNVNGRPQGPYFPFVGDGRNGYWLNDQLTQLELTERDLVWVNAVQPDGSATHPEAVRLLPNVRLIVAMGLVATRWAQQNFKDKLVISTPHPAYWARFQSRRLWPLHEHRLQLREIAEDIFA